MIKNLKKNDRESILILHNIRSNHNVGSLFRTAECAEIEKIILTGYTPAPLDKFGREVKEISKTALGAQNIVKWEKIKNINKVLENLLGEKFQIIAIEQAPNAKDYKKITVKNKVAFILGNEVKGLSKEILKKCDIVAEIPMRGKLARNRLKNDVGKESLNVSVAGGVAIFRMLNL